MFPIRPASPQESDEVEPGEQGEIQLEEEDSGMDDDEAKADVQVEDDEAVETEDVRCSSIFFTF